MTPWTPSSFVTGARYLPPGYPDAQEFVLCLAKDSTGLEVALIDTFERARRYALPSDAPPEPVRLARDAQNQLRR